ncbi:hypothetical protein DFR75_107232 [Nocardia ignorata]|uniref:Uncharacterized protein n=2 Tax=Nocardia ignorata TaxID=145285 RepID=A0A4R6P375_NOCIG|nr:hypothetical protein DFR75_107232 [Nocardia ignorata]
MLGVTTARSHSQGESMTDLHPRTSGRPPEPARTDEVELAVSSNAVPLFSTPHHNEPTAATPTTTGHQFPTFLAPAHHRSDDDPQR